LENNHGDVRKRDYLEFVSWEGQLDTICFSNLNMTEPAAGKKPFKSTPLRFNSVFEVSARAFGMLTDDQSGCYFSTTAS
jgi:hypothetical protein